MGIKASGTHSSCGCGGGCLGPLTFHSEAKGQLVTLSGDGRRASRDSSSFRHGIIFSNRPLRILEKVFVRVERSTAAWHGALRVGFTSVEPGSRDVPSLAIPELTDSPGYWAMPVPEGQCLPQSEVIFWVSHSGSLCIQTADGQMHEMMTSMDTQKPIWAMIDVYGQTNAVLLLGSVKKCLFRTRRSCPAPTADLTVENCGYNNLPTEILQRMMGTPEEPKNTSESMEECVVCYSHIADVVLTCGHRCVCTKCALRVFNEFGTCPLCRHRLRPLHPYECI